MDDENKYTVKDLIRSAVEQKPIDFEDTFNSLIGDKIKAAVDNRKVEIASSLYSSDDDEEQVEFDDSDEVEDQEFDDEDVEEYEEEEETDGEEAA